MDEDTRRLRDLNTVTPNYKDIPAPMNKRDVHGSAPELKTPFKRPETAQKWGVRD